MKTFVVRVWTPGDPAVEEPEALHGLVEHIGSGRSARFAGERELLAFLRGIAAAEPPGPSTPTLTPGGRQ